jgi:hypothetical protein
MVSEMFVRAKNRCPKRRSGTLAALAATIICASVFFLTGAVNVLASSGDQGSVKVYKMHRPGLRVRLQVQAGVIFPTRIWVRERCTNGFEGASELFLEEPTPAQEIRIDHRGRFKFVRDRFGGKTELVGHMYTRKITGYYLSWEYDGTDGVCGTGRPGDRALRFVARAR